MSLTTFLENKIVAQFKLSMEKFKTFLPYALRCFMLDSQRLRNMADAYVWLFRTISWLLLIMSTVIGGRTFEVVFISEITQDEDKLQAQQRVIFRDGTSDVFEMLKTVPAETVFLPCFKYLSVIKTFAQLSGHSGIVSTRSLIYNFKHISIRLAVRIFYSMT